MEKIKEKFKKLKLELTDQQAVQFFQYYEFLVEKNKVMNLTAIVDFDEVILKHFIDSLMIHQIVIPKGRLIDVGTGAGFPGIPLKIIYPDLDVVLLDSLNKRVRFFNEVIQKLGLEKIIAIHGRAEDLAKKDNYREQFDLCVSRAVANLSTLSEYCIPFVRKEGFFIAYKSGKIQEELESGRRAINILGGIIEEQREVLLPDTDVFRCIVKIRKTGYTPKKYPRKAGMPAKEPLCSK